MEHASARLTALRLARSRGSSTPVLVGPCLSEVGFEVLYWVPMLRRLAERHGVDPSRIVALSRGGAESWYEGVADRYVDVLDLLSLEEYRSRLAERRAETASEKQATVARFDRELLELTRRRLGLTDPIVVHPSLMVTRFRYFWANETDIKVVRRNTRFRRLDPPTVIPLDLPDDYVAVKPYFSSCFPDTRANRQFVLELVERLAESDEVVLLPDGFGLDDHGICELPEIDRVTRVRTEMTPRNNLSLQTQVVGQARALFTTYGGFSYVAPTLGVKVVGFYSEENFNPRHLDVARIAVSDMRSPDPSIVDARVTPITELVESNRLAALAR